MSSWPEFTLESFVERDRSICYGIVQPGASHEGGVPVVRVNNFKGGRIDTREVLTIDPEIERKYARSRLRGGELLITLVGTMGLSAIAPSELRGWNVARAVGVIPLKDEVDKRWINFVLRSQPSQQFIRAHANTTVQATFNLRDLSRLPIPMPPDKIREPASGLLSALDDKIELNRRTNGTLEAMARAIFKDWFVEFGPVHAKRKGQDRYLAPDVWRIFPEDIDVDGVPCGWRIGELSELVELNPKESLMKGAAAPYLEMAALPTRGPNAEPPVPRLFKSGMKFRNGDTLFARITPCLENGKTCFVQNLEAGSVGWGSTEFIVLRSRAPVPAGFSYLMARDDAFRMAAAQQMTGTSGRQRVSADALAGFSCAIPDERVWPAFGSLVDPIFELIGAKSIENETLVATRDILLPKLMSGEIRLKDAEKAVEEVA